MKTILTAVFLLISQFTYAQVYPVLHDADNLPIGNVVDINATSNGGRLAVMVSRQGYFAYMSYETGVRDVGRTDYPGISATQLFETADCTGDPVTMPSALALSGSITDSYFPGDLVEFDKEVFYVPFDTVGTSSVMIRSLRQRSQDGYCEPLDRCNPDDVRNYSELWDLITEPVDGPPDGWCEGEVPPATGQLPAFVAHGFRFSSLLVNDPSVTGFQSIAYKWPLRVKYVDIETVMTDGFESPTE